MVNKIKNQVIFIFISLFICASLIMGILFSCFDNSKMSDATNDSSNCTYLSDMDYEPESKAGWVDATHPQGRLLKDITVNNTKISVKIEGAWYSFDKGLFTHATANVYYNIQNCGYQYFTAYVGLDKTITKNSNGVKFYVYTSTDKTNWTLKTSEDPTVKTIGAEADFLSVDISGANYLRLHVDPNSIDRGDYAVWADAKLTNSPSGDDTIQSVDYYDEQIKAKGTTNIEEDKELELLVLQREFVRKVGQFALKKFMNEGDANKEVLDWLLNDVDNLREFMLGGDPMLGSYYNALTVLSNLYRNYKTDLSNDTLLNNKWAPKRTYGELYRTMMFSIALTHDSTVGSWMQKDRVENQSEPLRRYAIFRFLHQDGRFIATRHEDGSPDFETASWFESLNVEEMRWIMYNIIDDESIIWLNDFVQTKINANPGSVGGLHTPHSYIAYTDPNYNNPVFYDEENKDYFNDLFAVDDRNNPGQKIGMWDTSYTIPGGEDHETYTMTITRGTTTDKVMKVWMNFRNKFNTGCVCGGISKSGTNIRTARGIPSTVIGQPGHAAILYYNLDKNGNASWYIDNNVSGWNLSTKGERHLLGWGNQTWQRTHPTVVYFLLAQDALNNYDSYVLAEEYVMLAKVYQGDLTKQEQLYEKALTIQPINLDAWQGLVETYKASESKTQKDALDLGKRIADTMVGYPLPMYNLLNLLKPKFTTTESIYQYTLLENNALLASSALPKDAFDKTYQPAVAKGYALYLLGQVDTTVATFSFDGENAGSIVLSSRFDNTGIRWKYSLDGKQTWEEVTFTADEDHIHKLTPTELATITEENDIYILIIGVNETEDNYFKIDITSKPALPNTLYGNDLENKIMGVDEKYEWRYLGDEEWTSFTDAEPDCTGNKTIEIRIKASGGKPSSDIQTFEFTEDKDNENRKYVSVSHLSIEAYSSQSKDAKRPNYATNAIDGNLHTYWHTDYAEIIVASGNMPYLIIKLDTARHISGLEFIQYQYNPKINIFVKSAKVLVSSDNENWKEAGHLDDIFAVDDLKSVQFDHSVYGQYIKLEMETENAFATVSMVNVYEDITKSNEAEDTPTGNNTMKIVLPVAIGSAVAISAGVGITVFVKRKKIKK